MSVTKPLKIFIMFVALILAFQGVSEARSKWLFWCGVLLASSGSLAIADGLQMVTKSQYGDIAKPGYTITSQTQTVSATAPYNVTGANGTINNSGTTTLTNIVVKGEYIDKFGSLINADKGSSSNNVASVKIADLDVGQSETWALPDANLGDNQPVSFRYEATFGHVPKYGYADVTTTKDENEAYGGILAVIIGGYIMIDYLNHKEIDEDDLAKKIDYNVQFACNNGVSRILFSKRI